MAQLCQLYSSSGSPTAPVTETATGWTFTLNEKVGAGNLLALSATYPDGTAPTISDNNGNSWTSTLAVTNTSGGNDSSIWVLPNANAGQTAITLTFSAPKQPVWFECQEWSGLATSSPVNTTIKASAVTGPNLACGSVTPANNDANGGNLILGFFYDASGNNSGPTGWVPVGSFTLMQGNAIWRLDTRGQPSASTYFIQTAAAAVNPQITATSDTTGTYNCTGVALKLSPGAGTPPSANAIRIAKGIKQCMFTQNSVSSITTNFPTVGNLRVFMPTRATGDQGGPTSITDSEGNTWTDVSQSSTSPAVFYFKNAPANSSLTVTIHISSPTTGNLDCWLVDIANAATNTVVGATGHTNNATFGPGATGHLPDITPTNTSSLILCCVSNGLGPTTTLSSPPNATSNNVVIVAGGGTGEQDSGTVNSGDALGYLHNASLSAQSWTWNLANQTGVGAVAIEFLPGPAAANTSTPIGGITSSAGRPGAKPYRWTSL